MKKFAASSAATDEPKMLEWLRSQGQVEAIFESVKLRQRKQRRRRRAVASATTLVALLILTVLWGVPYARYTDTIVTRPASRQVVALQDGSRAELNAQTELFTDFRGEKRTVRMEKGEAFFVVSKDAAHPFSVQTPGGLIVVTGTEFNVRLTDVGAEVTLLEGSVRFEPTNGTSQHLEPRDQINPRAGAPRTLNDAELENVLAWRHGRAVFNGAPLAEAVERFASYHGKRITVAPQVKDLKVGGSYLLDNLPGFLDALEEMLPVKILSNGEGTYAVFMR